MALRLYSYGSHTIGTHVVFPELRPARDVSPSVFFRVHRKPVRAAGPVRRVREWRTKDGEVLAALHEAADGYVIHFMRLARFQVSRDSFDGSVHTLQVVLPCPDAPPLSRSDHAPAALVDG
jgi:hypothetical protein